MQPVPPGHVRITWTDTLTVPVSALTGARLDPACITAGEVENGSDLCAWLEDREDTEDADAEYQNVRSREIIRLDWPPARNRIPRTSGRITSRTRPRSTPELTTTRQRRSPPASGTRQRTKNQ